MLLLMHRQVKTLSKLSVKQTPLSTHIIFFVFIEKILTINILETNQNWLKINGRAAWHCKVMTTASNAPELRRQRKKEKEMETVTDWSVWTIQ